MAVAGKVSEIKMGRKKRAKKLEEIRKNMVEEQLGLDDEEKQGDYKPTVEEPKKILNGFIIDDKVVVKEDFPSAVEYYDKGCYGEITGVKEKALELSLVESLYLFERGKIKIHDTAGKELTFEKVLDHAKKVENNFWTRWCVYRDFRTRGYVLKTGLKFGHDFRVYPRGMKPGDEHAKWALFCVSEGDTETWRQFAAKMRVAHSTRKIMLIGCVDQENDITYWEIRWRKP